MKKVPKKIGHICISNQHFMNEFQSCIYDPISTFEFEEKWDELITKYEIALQNDWLKILYKCHRKWAPVCFKDTFFTGMSTSQRSDSINHFFDGFVTGKTTLSEFILKYTVALESRFDAENQAELKSLDTEAYLKTCSPFEKQAATIYTRNSKVSTCHPQRIYEDERNLTLRVKSFEHVYVRRCKESTLSITKNRKKKWNALVDPLNLRGTYADMPY
ncbi:hypothetical protein Taro_028789 [Colocasia esculenta]|uniref:Protein FAR1-RELATED SEQUENCE n=1 Tax=Colocasia esculenta TaxID=4460 RepID=A0A843VJH8_COLES|nr:hypothetical protein [Colocasia esculenta]